MLYHFATRDLVPTLRALVSKESPTVPTITGFFPSAVFYEREVHDMIGVRSEGHPDLRTLVLPDDWPKDVYPLRKDWTYNRGKRSDRMSSTFVLPIGPQHPALKEPISFRLKIDGETVVDADVRMGYNHRGIEKGTESRTYIQNLYLLERICGICSNAHMTCFAQGVEKLMGHRASSEGDLHPLPDGRARANPQPPALDGCRRP